MPASVHIISDYTARVGSVFRLPCEENNWVGEGNARGFGMDALCCVCQYSAACLPRGCSAFEIIDDYGLSISSPLKGNLCGLERCLPVALGLESFQQMSLWALEWPRSHRPAPARRCDAAPWGGSPSSTATEPCQPSFQPRRIHQACSRDQQRMMGIPVSCERSRGMSWP